MPCRQSMLLRFVEQAGRHLPGVSPLVVMDTAEQECERLQPGDESVAVVLVVPATVRRLRHLARSV